MARQAPRSPSPRRRQPIGRKAKPSSQIRSPCARTRVATTTSKPAARAARATGRRCEQKYQSSVTRNKSFGRRGAPNAVERDGTFGGSVISGKATSKRRRVESAPGSVMHLRSHRLDNRQRDGAEEDAW